MKKIIKNYVDYFSVLKKKVLLHSFIKLKCKKNHFKKNLDYYINIILIFTQVEIKLYKIDMHATVNKHNAGNNLVICSGISLYKYILKKIYDA